MGKKWKECKYMRTMLLSLRPDVYENILMGKKIYEHRKVFPNEPIKAYIYISRPIQAISGIIYLDNKVSLDDWLHLYSYDADAINRINEYKSRNNYAMEIVKFEETTQLSLDAIRKSIPKFVIPQMYYFLDNTELLEFIENNIEKTGKTIVHDFSNITSEMICQY